MGRRSAVAIAAALVIFVLAFAIARAVAGSGGDGDPAPVRDLPAAEVSIENLERAPSIKPLRSIAGTPPATANQPPAATTPAQP